MAKGNLTSFFQSFRKVAVPFLIFEVAAGAGFFIYSHIYKRNSQKEFFNQAAEVDYPERTINRCDRKSNSRSVGRALTTGEVILIQSIFGATVNPAPVRKYLLGNGYRYEPDATNCGGENIEFYGMTTRADDYSRAGVYPYKVFLHEMTHSWQKQNGISNKCRIYAYELDKKSNFSDYCDEQQARMIEDYAAHFLHLEPFSRLGVDFSLLAKTVETQFPEARKTRLALEQKNPRPGS
jgi:hypothetical protein